MGTNRCPLKSLDSPGVGWLSSRPGNGLLGSSGCSKVVVVAEGGHRVGPDSGLVSIGKPNSWLGVQSRSVMVQTHP